MFLTFFFFYVVCRRIPQTSSSVGHRKVDVNLMWTCVLRRTGYSELDLVNLAVVELLESGGLCDTDQKLTLPDMLYDTPNSPRKPTFLGEIRVTDASLSREITCMYLRIPNCNCSLIRHTDVDVSGRRGVVYLHCHLKFRPYVLLYERHDTAN